MFLAKLLEINKSMAKEAWKGLPVCENNQSHKYLDIIYIYIYMFIYIFIYIYMSLFVSLYIYYIYI